MSICNIYICISLEKSSKHKQDAACTLAGFKHSTTVNMI